MKSLTLTILLLITAQAEQYEPYKYNGGYNYNQTFERDHSNNHHLVVDPNGKYHSGDSYIMTPKGNYVTGDSYLLTPDGDYVGYSK